MSTIEVGVTILLSFLITLSGTSIFDQFSHSSPAETIPIEIMTDAISSGGMNVMFFGTYKEKHAFAKGYPTRFGQMSLNSDNELKYKYGWSERKIHKIGFYLGFSKLLRE